MKLSFLTKEAEIQYLLDELEKETCNCDIMNGYICGVHSHIKRLREITKE